MKMTKGQIYRCQNRDCGSEIQVTKSSIEAHLNPRCCCGALMKRPYTRPTFRILNAGDVHDFADPKFSLHPPGRN